MRKPLLNILLRTLYPKAGAAFSEALSWEYLSADELHQRQTARLCKLLQHCIQNVPYYRNYPVVNEAALSRPFSLETFRAIPPLTKDIIRSNYDAFVSDDAQKRRPYRNTSGGSSGRPLVFLQDRAHYETNVVANKLYSNYLAGKALGQNEVALWGSDIDIRKNSEGVSNSLRNLFYNRVFINCFELTNDKLYDICRAINRHRPTLIWSYVEVLDVLSRFITTHGIEVQSPRVIISTAGTLHKHIRARTQAVFGCPVLNQYGSREVGTVAIECERHEGLHTFPWTHYVEVVDGRLLLTALTNYSMPLLRYDIGDFAQPISSPQCSCGRNTLGFRSIEGRTIEFFRNENGDLVSGQALVHALYFRDFIEKFQIVQEEYGALRVRLVTRDIHKFESQRIDIESKFRELMGCAVAVEWDIVDDIPASGSGKFLYTRCKIRDRFV